MRAVMMLILSLILAFLEDDEPSDSRCEIWRLSFVEFKIILLKIKMIKML